MAGIVYIYTFPNGKRYIGQTTQSLEKRAQKGEGYKGQLVYNAIKKYGWENIEIEIFGCSSEEEMDNLEKEFIKLYQTENRDFGYNLESGGHERKHVSEDTKKKLSELNKGERHPMFGKHQTEEAKKKISNSLKGKYVGEKNSMFGKHHTEETRKKISEALKGRKKGPFSEDHKKHLSESHMGQIPSNAKKVICLETKQIFDTTGIAAKAVGLKSYQSIYHACQEKTKTAAGYHWMYLTDYEKLSEKEENQT